MAERDTLQTSVGRVGGHGRAHLALAQVNQRLALPPLDLAPVLEQAVGGQAGDQAAKAAASVHGRELLRIPNQHYLRPTGGWVVEQPAQLAAAAHARLIEDHD